MRAVGVIARLVWLLLMFYIRLLRRMETGKPTTGGGV